MHEKLNNCFISIREKISRRFLGKEMKYRFIPNEVGQASPKTVLNQLAQTPIAREVTLEIGPESEHEIDPELEHEIAIELAQQQKDSYEEDLKYQATLNDSDPKKDIYCNLTSPEEWFNFWQENKWIKTLTRSQIMDDEKKRTPYVRFFNFIEYTTNSAIVSEEIKLNDRDTYTEKLFRGITQQDENGN